MNKLLAYVFSTGLLTSLCCFCLLGVVSPPAPKEGVNFAEARRRWLLFRIQHMLSGFSLFSANVWFHSCPFLSSLTDESEYFSVY